jgi:two-component system response regulator HydG
LLRALQERTVRPIGGQGELAFDVRVVAATNEDVSSAVLGRRFRSDLYYRLNVIPIVVPPLRERGDDVVLLAHHFAAVYAKRHGRRAPSLSPEALDRLCAYAWPGNVRELQNYIERAMALGGEGEIGAWDLPRPVPLERNLVTTPSNISGGPSVGGPGLPTLAEIERRHVLHVLASVEGNKRLAARVLGIDRRTLYRKLEAYQGAEVTV